MEIQENKSFYFVGKDDKFILHSIFGNSILKDIVMFFNH